MDSLQKANESPIRLDHPEYQTLQLAFTKAKLSI